MSNHYHMSNCYHMSNHYLVQPLSYVQPLSQLYVLSKGRVLILIKFFILIIFLDNEGYWWGGGGVWGVKMLPGLTVSDPTDDILVSGVAKHSQQGPRPISQLVLPVTGLA